MTHPSTDLTPRTRLAARLKLILALTLVAGTLTLLQSTSFAPLPHRVDGFLMGFTVAMAVTSLVAWYASRR